MTQKQTCAVPSSAIWRRPWCPFFGTCGGCLYQDMPTDDYLAMKKQKVTTALARKAIDTNVDDVIAIPPHTRRRATFAVHKGRLGFHERKSHRLVEITQCLISVPGLESLILPLRKLAGQLGGSGDVSVLITDWGADIHWKSDDKSLPSLSKIDAMTDFCNMHGVARFVLNGTPMFQATQLPFPSDTFQQPSVEGEQALVRLVLDFAKGSKKAADLFCGQGTFTIPLTKAGIKTVGYDVTEAAIFSLAQKHIESHVRDLFRNPLIPEELNPFDLVVLDPARAGADHQCRQLAGANVPKVIMVSCNPSTFARDARILMDGGYALRRVVPVDQFVYSDHIELVSLFEK